MEKESDIKSSMEALRNVVLVVLALMKPYQENPPQMREFTEPLPTVELVLGDELTLRISPKLERPGEYEVEFRSFISQTFTYPSQFTEILKSIEKFYSFSSQTEKETITNDSLKESDLGPFIEYYAFHRRMLPFAMIATTSVAELVLSEYYERMKNLRRHK